MAGVQWTHARVGGRAIRAIDAQYLEKSKGDTRVYEDAVSPLKASRSSLVLDSAARDSPANAGTRNHRRRVSSETSQQCLSMALAQRIGPGVRRAGMCRGFSYGGRVGQAVYS